MDGDQQDLPHPRSAVILGAGGPATNAARQVSTLFRLMGDSLMLQRLL